MTKNTGKVGEKSGNFVSPEKWEPCYRILPVLYCSCVITCRRALRDTRGPWCTRRTSMASV